MSKQKGRTVYLDYNATTPYAPSVKEAMLSAVENLWNNPSSNYRRGKNAKEAIETARQQVAKMIGAHSSEIVFVSGGTEANNLAIKSALSTVGNSTTKPHVITTKIEHDATLKVLEHLERENEIVVTYLQTDFDGSVDPKRLVDAIVRETTLITLMLANNETGAITNLCKLCEILDLENLRRIDEGWPKIILHIDAAQAVGKIPISVQTTTVDYLSVVGHKFYGPRIGALYVKKGCPLVPLVIGGGQENGRRSGTENTACIIGLGEAARLVDENLSAYNSHFRKIKNYLKATLAKTFPNNLCTINFEESTENAQLPNTLSVSFQGKVGNNILEKCPELEASTGAACHSLSNINSSSAVLRSLLPHNQALGSIRLSVGRETVEDDIDLAVQYLKNAIND